ncbi:nitroreductase/quinone reductase family protein [Nonomuraea sp. 3N208]|uniref:nitroreductase/quinone reductase family protein n=1 Tax=Nonomuraea sp. 3N208 TaxID=3457421 RepID=UPI003FD2ECC8
MLTWTSRNAARVHTFLFRRTRARFGHRFRGGDVLLLTVRSRRSGQAFTIPRCISATAGTTSPEDRRAPLSISKRSLHRESNRQPPTHSLRHCGTHRVKEKSPCGICSPPEMI